MEVIAGAYGHLRVDNIDIAEVTNVTLDVEITREDVQHGLGVDSKITGVKGTGTITVDKVYSRFTDVFESIIKGKDKRFDLAVKNDDPDSVGGQIETISISGAWLTGFPLGFGDKSAKQTREYPIGFNPTNTSFGDKIV